MPSWSAVECHYVSLPLPPCGEGRSVRGLGPLNPVDDQEPGRGCRAIAAAIPDFDRQRRAGLLPRYCHCSQYHINECQLLPIAFRNCPGEQ